LATFKRRLPPAREIAYAYGGIAFPIFVIAIAAYIRNADEYVLRFSLNDVIGVAAYILGAALLESLVFLILMLVLAALLPASWVRDRFAVQSGVLVLLSEAWAGGVYRFVDFESLFALKLVAVIVLYVLTVAVGWLVVRRSARLERLIRLAVERVSVLSYIFVACGGISVVIVMVRNV
jgi:hypothetical protein